VDTSSNVCFPVLWGSVVRILQILILKLNLKINGVTPLTVAMSTVTSAIDKFGDSEFVTATVTVSAISLLSQWLPNPWSNDSSFSAIESWGTLCIR